MIALVSGTIGQRAGACADRTLPAAALRPCGSSETGEAGDYDSNSGHVAD